MKRTEIHLADEQAARLDRRAAEMGTSRAEVIREAIDAFLGPPVGSGWATDWQEAVRATAGIAPYIIPAPVDSLRDAGE